ncbi:MAG: hypothetical protein RLZZ507_4130 [Cyanobacteriota bacterium]
MLLVSNYLIPARGLKLQKKREGRNQKRGFQLPNPRKGTETFSLLPNGTRKTWSFQLPNPRKGTETVP